MMYLKIKNKTAKPKLPFQPLVKGHILMVHLCINTVCRERSSGASDADAIFAASAGDNRTHVRV